MTIMADTNSAVNITNSRFRASETPWILTVSGFLEYPRNYTRKLFQFFLTLK